MCKTKWNERPNVIEITLRTTQFIQLCCIEKPSIFFLIQLDEIIHWPFHETMMAFISEKFVYHLKLLLFVFRTSWRSTNAPSTENLMSTLLTSQREKLPVLKTWVKKFFLIFKKTKTNQLLTKAEKYDCFN